MMFLKKFCVTYGPPHAPGLQLVVAVTFSVLVMSRITACRLSDVCSSLFASALSDM